MQTRLVRLWVLVGAGILVLSMPISAQTLDDAFNFSASGLLVHRVRLTTIAENVANILTFKDEATGLPYQKQIVVLEPTETGVRVSSIQKSTEPFGRYYDPAVPQSDSEGYFYYPNVNLPTEMVDLSYTEAMFEANVTTFKVTKAMYQQVIDVLK